MNTLVSAFLRVAGAAFFVFSFLPSLLADPSDILGNWELGSGSVIRVSENGGSYRGVYEELTQSQLDLGIEYGSEAFVLTWDGSKYTGSASLYYGEAELRTCPGLAEQRGELELRMNPEGALVGWLQNYGVNADCEPEASERFELSLDRLRYRASSEGAFRALLSDGESYVTCFESEFEEGFLAEGRWKSINEDGSIFRAEFEVDTSEGRADLSYLIADVSEIEIPVNSKIPAPDLKGVEAYFKALSAEDLQKFTDALSTVAATLVLMPDGPALPAEEAEAEEEPPPVPEDLNPNLESDMTGLPGRSPLVERVRLIEEGGSPRMVELFFRRGDTSKLRVTQNNREMEVVARHSRSIVARLLDTSMTVVSVRGELIEDGRIYPGNYYRVRLAPEPEVPIRPQISRIELVRREGFRGLRILGKWSSFGELRVAETNRRLSIAERKSGELLVELPQDMDGERTLRLQTIHDNRVYFGNHYKIAIPRLVIERPLDPEEDERNEYLRPRIIWITDTNPIPGGRIEVVGIWPDESYKAVSFTAGAAPPILGRVINSSRSRMTVEVPTGLAPGRVEVRVSSTRDGVTTHSDRKKIKIYATREEAATSVKGNLQSAVQGSLESVLENNLIMGVARAVSTFTQKKGRFRYPVFSVDAEVAPGTVPLKWLVVIEGEFRKRYKDATFELLVALVPSKRESAYVNKMEDVGLSLVKIAKLDITRNEAGQKIFRFQVTNEALAERLGITGIDFNSDSDEILLANLFELNLEEEGIELAYNTENNSIRLAVEKGDRRLEINVGGEDEDENGEEPPPIVNLKHNAHRVIDGRRHEFTLDHGRLGTRLRGRVRAGDSETSRELMTWEMDMDDRAREPGEPIPNVDMKVTLDPYRTGTGRVRLLGEAKIRDHNLKGLDFRTDITGSDTVRALNFGLSYEGEDENRERKWKLSSGIRTEFDTLDLELGLTGDVEARVGPSRTLNSIKATGRLDVELEAKRFDVELYVGGEYERIYRGNRMPGENWRVFGGSTIEFMKVGLNFEGAYVRRDGERSWEATGGLELGGLLSTLSKQVADDDEFELFREGSDD